MTKERFTEILKEYGFSVSQIELIWKSRPPGELNEQRLRETAKHLAPTKDRLRQA